MILIVIIRNEIIYHLCEQFNVQHINYISKRLNQRNWFNVEKSNSGTHLPIGRSDLKIELIDNDRHYIPEQLNIPHHFCVRRTLKLLF